MKFSLQVLWILAVALGFSAVDANASSVSVYLSRPGSQASTMVFSNGAGLLTETFDSGNGLYVAYSSAIGTYAGPMLVQSADQYGGAKGTSYLTFGAQNGTSGPVALYLNAPANYFGFWWSAGDPYNGVSLYSGGNLVSRFSAGDLTGALQHPKVTAIDNIQYDSSSYYCNPNNLSQDCGEAFAYVNMIVIGGSFDAILFDNSGTAATGFESDNHSVAFGTPVFPTSFVGTQSDLMPTPEPGTAPLVLAGCVLVGCGVFRPRKTAGDLDGIVVAVDQIGTQD